MYKVITLVTKDMYTIRRRVKMNVVLLIDNKKEFQLIVIHQATPTKCAASYPGGPVFKSQPRALS